MKNNFFSSKIFNNFSWIFFQNIVQLGSSLVTGVILARYFGPSNYGDYSLILAIITVSNTVSTFGLNHVITKEIKNRKDLKNNIIVNGLVIRLSAAFLSNIIFFFVLNSILKGKMTLEILVAMSFQVFTCLKIVEFYFLAESNLKSYSTVSIISSLISLLAKVLLALNNFPISSFLYLLAFDALLLGLGVWLVFLKSTDNKLELKIDRNLIKDLTRKGLPLAFSSLTAMVYLKLDIIMLSSMSTSFEVGQYAVASRLSEVWYVFPVMVASAIFPKLLELKSLDTNRYERELQRVLYVLSFSAFIVATGAFLFGEFAVLLLFGENYDESVKILQIHIWAGIFVFMRAVVSKWFIAEDLYYLSVLSHSMGALSNALLNLVLIPNYGGVGAAIATILSYAFASYISLFFSKRGRMMAIKMTFALAWPTYFLKFRGK